MRGTWIILLVLPLMLAACSRPKSLVIPTDSSKWSSLADQTKDLESEDKRLLGAYLVRAAAREALAHEQGVPPGTTVGEAIYERDFEAKQKVEEAQAEALKARALAEHNAAIAHMKHLVTFAMVSKTYVPKNIYAERFNDRVTFVIAIKNNSPKNIAGVKGVIVFQDMFGSPIKRMNLSLDESIPARGEKIFDRYYMDVNQFESEDQKLAGTDLQKMKVIFEPEMIVFADGSKETAPEAQE
jgi:hypothetical protein